MGKCTECGKETEKKCDYCGRPCCVDNSEEWVLGTNRFWGHPECVWQKYNENLNSIR